MHNLGRRGTFTAAVVEEEELWRWLLARLKDNRLDVAPAASFSQSVSQTELMCNNLPVNKQINRTAFLLLLSQTFCQPAPSVAAWLGECASVFCVFIHTADPWQNAAESHRGDRLSPSAATTCVKCERDPYMLCANQIQYLNILSEQTWPGGSDALTAADGRNKPFFLSFLFVCCKKTQMQMFPLLVCMDFCWFKASQSGQVGWFKDIWEVKSSKPRETII